MKHLNFKEILLSGLCEPEHRRVEYWQQLQKESDYSELVFIRSLLETWHEYNNRIEAEMKIKDLSYYAIPLLHETINFTKPIKGHLDQADLASLFGSLIEYNNAIKPPEIKSNLENVSEKLTGIIKTSENVINNYKALEVALTANAAPLQSPKSLADIFPKDPTKILIVKEAIKDVSITKGCSERTITGFIEICKVAEALPDMPTNKLMIVIYNEIGKSYKTPPKSRPDQPAYFRAVKRTKKHFGIK